MEDGISNEGEQKKLNCFTRYSNIYITIKIAQRLKKRWVPYKYIVLYNDIVASHQIQRLSDSVVWFGLEVWSKLENIQYKGLGLKAQVWSSPYYYRTNQSQAR